MFSGQFSEALQALLDWLAKVEPTLVEDQPVYGDVFTVNNLMEIHKVCQSEEIITCIDIKVLLLNPYQALTFIKQLVLII